MRALPSHRAVFIWLGILLPLWLVIGRPMLGSIGWMTVMLVSVGLPVLLGPLLTALVYFFLPQVRDTKHLRPEHVKLLWMMHGLLFSCGFFLVDFGDTEDSAVSVFTAIFGARLLDLSSLLAVGLAALGLIALLASFVIGVREMVRQRRAMKAVS